MRNRNETIIQALCLILISISLSGCTSAEEQVIEVTEESDQEGIIFVSDRGGNFDIFLLELGTGRTIQLTDHESLDYAPSYTDACHCIYFYSTRDGNQEIYRHDLTDSTLTRITETEHLELLPMVSPDGAHIAYIGEMDTSGRDLYLMTASGTEVQTLTDNDLFEESPSWSPDGDRLLFTRQYRAETDSGHAANGEIHVLDLKTKEVHRLTYKDGFDSGAVYSPDGKRIAFYGEYEGKWDIYLMEADGSDVINLTSDTMECYSPSWSPDGRSIAYTGGASEDYQIWTIEIETGKKHQHTNVTGRNVGPVWIKIPWEN